MENKFTSNPHDMLSPDEMKGWLAQEIRDSAKAHELRVREATDFVTAYASGKIGAEEASARLLRYDRRWGEALPGVTTTESLSDERILEAIDRAREQESFSEKPWATRTR